MDTTVTIRNYSSDTQATGKKVTLCITCKKQLFCLLTYNITFTQHATLSAITQHITFQIT